MSLKGKNSLTADTNLFLATKAPASFKHSLPLEQMAGVPLVVIQIVRLCSPLVDKQAQQTVTYHLVACRLAQAHPAAKRTALSATDTRATKTSCCLTMLRYVVFCWYLRCKIFKHFVLWAHLPYPFLILEEQTPPLL